jgi:hypothetical protein
MLRDIHQRGLQLQLTQWFIKSGLDRALSSSTGPTWVGRTLKICDKVALISANFSGSRELSAKRNTHSATNSVKKCT